MSYVKKTLLPDESVVVSGKLHWWIYVRPCLVILVGMVLLPVPPVGPAFLFVGIIDALRAWIERLSTELAVTNRRVIAKFGFISRSTTELGHKKVESILVDQGILGRILNFGTITVRGSGGTNTPIPRIAKPLEFRRLALQSIETGN